MLHHPHIVAEPLTFHKLWSLGYHRLVPVIPPGVELSPRSSLHGRLLAGKDERGKTPGRRNAEGQWSSFDWTAFECTEADVSRFDVMGCSIGIKTGSGLIAVDLDSTDAAAAEWLYQTALEVLGPGAVRIGRWPKRLLLFRCSAPLAYDKLKFATATEQDPRKPALVEILTEGRQFVAAGIHPVTMKPYAWPDGLPPREALPEVTPEAVGAFMAAVASHFPAAERFSASGGDRAATDQSALAGDPELVRRAVAALPNRSDLFPSRDDYLRVGYAVKAAVEDEGEAYDLWAQWCGRWDGGVNDPAVMEADWARMKPPYGLGATWLYEQAERLGGWMGRVERWFQPITEADLESHVDAAPKAEPTIIEWIAPASWEGVEPQPRKWIVPGLIPDNEVTLLTGHGGLGKSLLAQQLLTCSAAGIPWLGQQTAQRKTMGFFCEDHRDEIHRRQIDLNAFLGVSWERLDGMRVTSRKNHENVFVTYDRLSNGVMRITDLFKRVVVDARRFSAGLVVLDGLADIFPGNENDRSQVKTFVNAVLSRLAAEIGGAVVVLAHPSKSGLETGDGYSGSTGWPNAVRSLVYMHAPENAPAGTDVRVLENKKLNYGRSGSALTVRWERGAFAPVSSAMFVDEGGAALPQTLDMAAAAVLEGVRRCAGTVSLSFAERASNRVDKELLRRFPELFTEFEAGVVERATVRLMQEGKLVSADSREKDARGRVRKTIVVRDEPVSPGDLFT